MEIIVLPLLPDMPLPFMTPKIMTSALSPAAMTKYLNSMEDNAKLLIFAE
jgi:hypothetical protein